ncbi:MAG: arsenic resistance N-acetyltransferase ArsN2 [Gammaproteobacteria bacterium]|jgi:amino-acid N-acetyltransferase|nr:arsenic resistance N-acetyltransferase ArsN2 [Gammaproteobacteria bacterium]
MQVEPIELTDQAIALLLDEGLPVKDLLDPNLVQLFGGSINGQLIGIVGIENYGNVGLLRSLAVKQTFRSGGYGRKLVTQAEVWAYARGIQSLYLLTTTAVNYFAQLGYKIVPRNQAPDSVANTAQFTNLCPSSAIFMCKRPGAKQKASNT